MLIDDKPFEEFVNASIKFAHISGQTKLADEIVQKLQAADKKKLSNLHKTRIVVDLFKDIFGTLNPDKNQVPLHFPSEKDYRSRPKNSAK